jgi:hypothetical protein
MTPCRWVDSYRSFGGVGVPVFRIHMAQEQEHSCDNFKFDDAISYKVITQRQST